MATGTLFTCDGVSRSFGSLKAVGAVSLTVDPGEIPGIGGPNGAGKTTLFDVVTGLTPPTAGRAFFGDRNITGLGADRICRLGIARTFQLDAAFDAMTVIENVQVAAHFGRARRRLPGLRLGRGTRDAAGLAGKAHAAVAGLPVLDRKLLTIAGAQALCLLIVTDKACLTMVGSVCRQFTGGAVGFYAVHVQAISPTIPSPSGLLFIIAATVVVGIGSFRGPFVGTVILMLAGETMREAGEYRTLAPPPPDPDPSMSRTHV